MRLFDSGHVDPFSMPSPGAHAQPLHGLGKLAQIGNDVKVVSWSREGSGDYLGTNDEQRCSGH